MKFDELKVLLEKVNLLNTKTKDFDKSVIKAGRKVEHEHTTSDKGAEKIAKQHMAEFPKLKSKKISSDYYKELDKLEKNLDKRKTKSFKDIVKQVVEESILNKKAKYFGGKAIHLVENNPKFKARILELSNNKVSLLKIREILNKEFATELQGHKLDVTYIRSFIDKLKSIQELTNFRTNFPLIQKMLKVWLAYKPSILKKKLFNNKVLVDIINFFLYNIDDKYLELGKDKAFEFLKNVLFFIISVDDNIQRNKENLKKLHVREDVIKSIANVTKSNTDIIKYILDNPNFNSFATDVSNRESSGKSFYDYILSFRDKPIILENMLSTDVYGAGQQHPNSVGFSDDFYAPGDARNVFGFKDTKKKGKGKRKGKKRKLNVIKRTLVRGL